MRNGQDKAIEDEKQHVPASQVQQGPGHQGEYSKQYTCHNQVAPESQHQRRHVEARGQVADKDAG